MGSLMAMESSGGRLYGGVQRWRLLPGMGGFVAALAGGAGGVDRAGAAAVEVGQTLLEFGLQTLEALERRACLFELATVEVAEAVHGGRAAGVAPQAGEEIADVRQR